MTTRLQRAKRHHCRPQSGFTLLELIITICIVAILGVLAAPSLREARVNATVNGSTNDLVTALNMARSEAVKRGRNVVVVAEGGTWTAGWSVQEQATAQVLVSHPALPDEYRITAAAGGGGPSDTVVFAATGALAGATSFNFSVCRPSYSPGDAQSRRIIIEGPGSIRSRRNTSGSPAGSCS